MESPVQKLDTESRDFAWHPKLAEKCFGMKVWRDFAAVVVYLVRGKGYTGVRLVMSVGCAGCDCIFNALEFEGPFYCRMGNAFLLVRPSLFPIFFASQMTGV